jgi:hypothetical protein
MFTGIGLIAFGCIFGAAPFGLFFGHCLGEEPFAGFIRASAAPMPQALGEMK